MQAGPILYEPLQIMRIEVPNDYVGEISKLVSSKRGQLLEMNQEGDITVIEANFLLENCLGGVTIFVQVLLDEEQVV